MSPNTTASRSVHTRGPLTVPHRNSSGDPYGGHSRRAHHCSNRSSRERDGDRDLPERLWRAARPLAERGPALIPTKDVRLNDHFAQAPTPSSPPDRLLSTQACTTEPAASTSGGVTSRSAGQAPNSEVPPMSPKREPRFWNREHAPLIMLGVGLVLVMIAAGIVQLDVE